jgi:sialate O-acetylesterase
MNLRQFTAATGRAMLAGVAIWLGSVLARAQSNAPLASYDAGTNGPAPDPVSLGWIKGGGSGGNFGPVSPDGAFGVNAWTINDNTGSAIGANYRSNFTAAQFAAATSNGWDFRATLRMTNGYSGVESIHLHYDNGASRWFWFVDVNTSGRLTARVFNNGSGSGATYIVQTNHDGLYHEFLLAKDPTSSNAQLFWDSTPVCLIGPYAASATPGVTFGAGSTGGDGAANFHRVSFTVRAPATNPLPSTLQLARVFTHHAVLQREQACPVFGVDVPGTTITVMFAGQTLNTTADTNGNWRVDLAPMPANTTPRDLTVVGSTNVTLTNILVGDVWLISGQSNADFPLSSATGGAAAIAAATNTLLRYLQMAESPTTTSAAWNSAQLARLNVNDYFSCSWQVCSPASAGAVSAIGYFFAQQIQTNQGVPIGLIDCAVGGTMTESWIPDSALAASPRLKAIADNFLDSDMVAAFAKTRTLQNLATWNSAGRPAPMPDHPYKPGVCWRFGLAPIVPFALRGVLWYQGETNADFYDPFDYDLMARWHTDAFRALVASWRAAWRRDDLPFYCVQLPRLNRPSWPWFRESQLKCALTVSNTTLAVAWDYGNPGDVHPTQKEPVAHRLALIARARSYGENVEWSGPLYRSQRVEGTNIILEFTHAESGLVANDNQPLRLFQIAGTNRQFFDASAVIVGSNVIVSAPQVPQPVAVRYAWVPDGSINFFNGAGLTASPFRTDRWTTTNRPVRVACIGDSITFGLGIANTNQTYPAQLQTLLGGAFDARNFGKSGCTVTRDSVSGWARGYILQSEHTNALAFAPDVVICNLGINDVSGFAQPNLANFVRDYREIIAAYRALPTAPRFILWQPLAPLFPGQTYYGQPVVTNVNNLIRQVADVSGADAMDMAAPLAGHPEWFPDHIHPNADGARRIAEVTHGFLMQTLEAPAGTQLSRLDATRSNNDELVLSFSAAANVGFALQTSAQPGGADWVDWRLFSPAAAPRVLSVTNPLNEGGRFFRLRLDNDE